MALPKRLAQVVDPMLLPREVEELGVATVVMMAIEKDDNDNEIEVEEANYIEDLGILMLTCKSAYSQFLTLESYVHWNPQKRG